ncbi:hypothetical protein DMP17_00250 [Pseudonocardia sp. TMWB2A]
MDVCQSLGVLPLFAKAFAEGEHSGEEAGACDGVEGIIAHARAIGLRAIIIGRKLTIIACCVTSI